MPKPFLTAAWRNLLMANYAIEPAALKPHLPCGTELDDFSGVHYVSLVGFLFADVKVLGFSIPFHRNFEEVNLRFYVRYKEGGEWRRGVVFLKEIVPRRAITFVANTLYGENYATHPTRHHWQRNGDTLDVGYSWKVKGTWNHMKATAEAANAYAAPGSQEEFITEHYWGYTFINESCSGAYQVAHPSWRLHNVLKHEIRCDAETLYGPAFAEALAQTPSSVFLAEGSEISVMKGTKIFANKSLSGVGIAV